MIERASSVEEMLSGASLLRVLTLREEYLEAFEAWKAKDTDETYHAVRRAMLAWEEASHEKSKFWDDDVHGERGLLQHQY